MVVRPCPFAPSASAIHRAERRLPALICRYRPRGVSRAEEPWDAWCPELGPSKELHAAVYGKGGAEPIDFAEYERRFRSEMASRAFFLDGFAARVRRGETITLLCSSACTDASRCHRSIVQAMLEERATLVQALPQGRTTPLKRRSST